jgi:hypothetical protein
LFAVKIDKRTEIAGIVKEEKKVKEVTSMEAHQCLGHLSQQSTKDTAKQLGWHLTGEFVKCEDCAIGKGCQKNFNKRIDHKIAGMVGFWMLHWFKNSKNLTITWSLHKNNTGE